MQKVIPGTIHQGDFQALIQLMRDQSSCRRFAYQRIHKDGLAKVWTHTCEWGCESMEILPEDEEVRRWWRAVRSTEEIAERIRMLTDSNRGLSAIREAILNSDKIIGGATETIQWCRSVLSILETTSMYVHCDSVYRKAMDSRMQLIEQRKKA